MTKNYIFGYGSLIAKESRDKTANSNDWYKVRINGFQRLFVDNDSKELGLPVVIQKTDYNYNGILFEVNENVLKNFDKREGDAGYKRIKLNYDKIESINHINLDSNSDYWVYVWDINKITHEFPTIQSYIDVILNGCLEQGDEFAEEFIKTTYNWPELNNDRENPVYPRAIKNPPTDKIDSLLELIK